MTPPTQPRRSLWLLVTILCLAATAPASAAQAEREVYVLTVDDAISNATVGYLDRGIGLAERRGAQAVVVLLNTPGGDLASMERIMERFENAEVPVIVYVWPRGGMAASAGTLITLAASGAAMAPHTTIGAAHPIPISDQTEVDEIALEKTTNVVVEQATGLAARRGEAAVAWVERAIRDSETASAEEALEMGVIDLVANGLDDLLEQFDGRTVPLGAEEETLDLAGAVVREIKMSTIERVLNVLINPNIAFLLLGTGLLLIYLELSAPGGWVAGFTGVLCLALAAYSLHILPFNWLGLVLMGVSFVLFYLDLLTPGIEALTFAGAGSLIAGGLILFNTTISSPYGKVSVPLVVGTGVAIGAFFLFIVAKGLRAQGGEPVTGPETLIGSQGVVRTPLDPDGTVQVAGEVWTATAVDGPLTEGEPVQILRREGLRLYVEPSSDTGDLQGEEEN